MPQVLFYLFKFSISLALMYSFYHLVLRPLTFYQWNRFYLLGYSLISFLVPLVDVTVWLGRENVAENNILQSIPAMDHLKDGMVSAAEINAGTASFNYWNVAGFVLLAGILGMLGRLLSQFFSLRRVRRATELISDGDIRLYNVRHDIPPFSFGNTVFVNRELHTEEELQKIIAHEMVHVQQRHSVDIILVECLCIFNWFNPFAWLVRRAVRQNLEFIADDQVLQRGLDARQYQYLLLKVVGIPQYSLANNFNLSSLKKRIAMINKMKSAKVHLMKFLFVFPLMAVMSLAFRGKMQVDSTPVITTDTVPAAPAAPTGKTTEPPAIQESTPAAPVMQTTPVTPVIPVPPAPKPSPQPKVVVSPRPAATPKPVKKRVIMVKDEQGKTIQYDLNKPADQEAFETAFGYQRVKPDAPVKVKTNVDVKVKPSVNIISSLNPGPIYIVDGKTMSASSIHSIEPNSIAEVKVLKGSQATDIFGHAGTEGVIVINTKVNVKAGVSIAPDNVVIDKLEGFEGLILIDGKESTKEALQALPANSIKTLNVTKSETNEYKDKPKARKGVLSITTKDAQ